MDHNKSSTPPPHPNATAQALSQCTRNVALHHETAIIVIDMQNAFANLDSSLIKALPDKTYVEKALPQATANIALLLSTARQAGIEIIYTVVEALTKDGREVSLDYKLSNLSISRASWGARVINELIPHDDDIILPKLSSSVFISTNIAYILRNLGIRQVVLCGGLTDQCIDSAVRDACDLGFLVTTVTDACYTHSKERHLSALRNNIGYTRQLTTAQLNIELANISTTRPVPSAAIPSYIRFEITDMNGKALCKVIPYRHRNSPVYMYSGALAMGCVSAVMEIPRKIREAGRPSTQLMPDWSTETALPWAAHENAHVYRVICEQKYVTGSEHDHVPRAACRRLLQQLADRNLQLLSASEFEFAVANADGAPLFIGNDIFATLQGEKTSGFQYAIEQGMQAVGIDVQTMNAEYGPGQLEITYAPKYGIEAPDAAVTFRTGVKEIAMRRDIRASFATMPFALTGVGNGGHFNFSLWTAGETKRCVMCKEGKMSTTAKQFLAGVLKHAPAMEALCAPTPMCYKRHGNWSPVAANWGLDDRTAAVRVKMGGEKTYFEFRSPSAAANPYLVTAAVLVAGLDGLERDLVLPEMGLGDVLLPTSLEEALDALVADKILVERLGNVLVSWFVDVKMAEIDRIETWIQKGIDAGMSEDEARLKAWRDMYFEYL